jgi:AcrR family transcriptional regulator
MSIRKRLSPSESRRVAIEAARTLLIEAGPQAVTLKAVGARMGRTHANLLHHFGSATELQQALAEYLAATVCDSIAEAARAAQAGIGSPREVVDLTFDAFDREGGGALASWMLLTGNEHALDPIVETIHQLVDELHPDERETGSQRTMHEATLALVLMALGDALIGERLSASLGVSRDTARERAEAMLVASFLASGAMS